MIVLSLTYTLFFIASTSYVRGFDNLNSNFTNDIESLASYLKEHSLTIVDSGNKRILHFIVNKNISQHFRRSNDNDGIELQVENRINYFMNALRSGVYSTPVEPEPDFQGKVAYVDEFMKPRTQSTAYLYKELLRIKRKGVVKDSLRKMISFMEMPQYHWVSRKVFKCFIEARKKAWEPPAVVYWNYATNDITFNTI